MLTELTGLPVLRVQLVLKVLLGLTELTGLLELLVLKVLRVQLVLKVLRVQLVLKVLLGLVSTRVACWISVKTERWRSFNLLRQGNNILSSFSIRRRIAGATRGSSWFKTRVLSQVVLRVKVLYLFWSS